MSEILDIFKALADEGRLRILRSIDQAELSVAELVQALDMPQSTVSRHLKPMRESGLVASRRDGTSVFYNRGPLFRDEAFTRILSERLREIPVAHRDAAAVERVVELRRRKSREFFDEIAGRYGTLTEPGGDGRRWRPDWRRVSQDKPWPISVAGKALWPCFWQGSRKRSLHLINPKKC